jgi:pimeloyl-ACP methyl ester carboxylesterase
MWLILWAARFTLLRADIDIIVSIKARMAKQHLLLLHGALGASDQFASLSPLLQEKYYVHLLDFEGHGIAPLQPRPFHIEHFVGNVLDYLKQESLERIHIFGYSMGGYVACSLARSVATLRPESVQSIVTLGTKFHWDREVAAREVAYLDTEKIAAKVPNFARTLAERHTTAGWETVVNRTAEMLQWLGEQGGLTPKDVAPLEQCVRIMLGDGDATVGLTESYEMFKAIRLGEMEILPATPHQLEKVSPSRLAYSFIEFFG